jgi:uncharacterized membrane protein YphA (DoxX/SURF4 family)
MTLTGAQNPRWVNAILYWRWTWLLARIGLLSIYLVSGFTKLLDFPTAIVELEHLGFHPGWLWVTIVIVAQIGGSLLLIWGRFVWLAAGTLGVLTFVAIFAADHFWTMTGEARFAATNAFFEHFGLISGFVMAALLADHDEHKKRLPSGRG